ncbi:MAG: hypothetical protein KIS92_13905 [Planctomycetota bacterium]|nr:hypothetical protein [Planctomycetota bacterium]
MLDFYLCPEDALMPETPDDLQYAGSISMSEHARLKPVQDVLGYFEDTKLTLEMVHQLKFALERLHAQSSDGNAAACEKMLQILAKSIAAQMGLVAFCD